MVCQLTWAEVESEDTARPERIIVSVEVKPPLLPTLKVTEALVVVWLFEVVKTALAL